MTRATIEVGDEAMGADVRRGNQTKVVRSARPAHIYARRRRLGEKIVRTNEKKT